MAGVTRIDTFYERKNDDPLFEQDIIFAENSDEIGKRISIGVTPSYRYGYAFYLNFDEATRLRDYLNQRLRDNKG